MDSKLESLILNIVKIAYTNDKNVLNSVYNKIVFYIILNSGLGTPDNKDVVHETRAALSSVFHFYAVKPFLKKSEDEKREQLKQLTNIVMGIRLFYWHHGEYGNGIENVPEALVKGINKSIHDLLNQIGNIEHQLENVTKAIRNHYKIVYVENKNKSSIHNDFKSKDLDDVQFIKCTINILHQCKKFFLDIIDILKYAQHDVSKTIGEFHEALVDIQKFTKYKNKYIVTEYVPTEVVVHKFTNVATLWKTLWKYLVSVHLLNDLEESLSSTLKGMKLPSQEIITYLTRDAEESNEQEPYGEDYERIDESKISNSNCKLVKFKPDIRLQIEGFSALIFILEGFLVSGKPELGLIQYRDEFHSFSSPKEAYMFCQDADRYSTMLFDTIRVNPELIDFFKMKESLCNVKQVDMPVKPKKCESGIQTELHPIKNHFDKNYHFNAYELMRRHWKKTQSYLKSENKATKTCSTAESSTQTYDIRSASTQESDKATSTPKPIYYVYGLRGFDNDSIVQDKEYTPLLNFKL